MLGYAVQDWVRNLGARAVLPTFSGTHLEKRGRGMCRERDEGRAGHSHISAHKLPPADKPY